MPKKLTKATNYKLLAEIFTATRDGREPVLKLTTTERTHPVVACEPLCEAEVLKLCKRWLEKRASCRRLNNGFMANSPDNALDSSGYQYGMKGAGDLQVIYNGLHIDVECKHGKGGTLSEDQIKRRKDVERHGGVYLVVHGLPELEYLWNEKVLTRF